MKRAALLLIFSIGISGILIACSGGVSLRELAASRSVNQASDGPVVVFLPGTLASTLVDTETNDKIWGLDNALSVDPREAAGLRRLSLPLDAVPSDVSAAPDSIVAVDVLRRANERILGIPISLSIYEDMLTGLVAAGLPETPPMAIPELGPSLTTFPYDWRRSIVDAAQALGKSLESRGEGAKKVHLVGHSMGGVIALWYLMYGTASLDSAGAPPAVTWAGAEYVEQAILVGAPLRGAAVAVRNTVNGNTLAGPLVPTLPPAMIASHPSTFELMPRGDVLDGTDASLMASATWREFGWGMSDPRQSENVRVLARGALDPMALAEARQSDLIARGRAFHRAADQPIDPPNGLSLTVIAGFGSDTLERVQIGANGELTEKAFADGDGTVLLSSVLGGFEDAAEHPRKAVHYYEVEHSRMLSAPPVFNKVLDLVLE